MLVLTRRLGEKLSITLDGKELIVTFIHRKGGQIRLGFSGDKDFQIDRVEKEKKPSEGGFANIEQKTEE